MRGKKPTYQQLERRLAEVDPVIEVLKHHEVDAVVGEGKIAFLLLRGVEEALRKSEEEFRAMFELSGVGMIQAVSPAFRFTKVNPMFCEIMGYSTEELLSKTLLGVTHPDDRHESLMQLGQMIRGKTERWSTENRLVRKDGSFRWVNVHGAALRNNAGRLVQIIAMVADITSRKQAQQEIAQILQTHLSDILAGARRRLGALELAQGKTDHQALMKLQIFIQESLGAPPSKSRAGKREASRRKK